MAMQHNRDDDDVGYAVIVEFYGASLNMNPSYAFSMVCFIGLCVFVHVNNLPSIIVMTSILTN